ncbi:Hypothetical predicted protein, partial [Mytilus galloprovincialis]
MAKKYVNSNLYFAVRAKKMLVAALNIGTAFSACAFSFQVDFEKDPMFIVSNTWTCISRALKSINVPTVVLLDKSKKFLSFGYDAEEQYLEIALDEEHHDYYYFCDFKMLLNALQAGISMEHLSLCFKPEAASLLCQYSLTEKPKNKDDVGNVFTQGTKHMVIDLEDETTEITCHQKGKHDSFIELNTPPGGPSVGLCLDEAFNRLLIKIFGAHHFRKFQEENKMEALDLLKYFRHKKIDITNETTRKVSITLPVQLRESFEKDTDEIIKDVIKQMAYEDNICWCANKLRIDANFFRTLFNEPKTHLINHVQSLLTKSHLKDVSTLLMVGGFSKSPIMQSAVKDAFPGMTVFAPPDPGLAVLK